MFFYGRCRGRHFGRSRPVPDKRMLGSEVDFFYFNPFKTKILKITPLKLFFQELAHFRHVKFRGVTNSWVTPHEVAQLIYMLVL
jgi:hypothetical protein